jgi:hypothetical protein
MKGQDPMQERNEEMAGAALAALLAAVEATRAASDAVAAWVGAQRPAAEQRLGLKPGAEEVLRDEAFDAALDRYAMAARAHSAAKRALVAWSDGQQ